MREIESLDQAIPSNLVPMRKMTALADLVRLLFKFQEANPKTRVSKSFEEWLENNLVLDAKNRLEKSIELQSNSASTEPTPASVQNPSTALLTDKKRPRGEVSVRATTAFTSTALSEANIPTTPSIGSARTTIHSEPAGLRTTLEQMTDENKVPEDDSAEKPAVVVETKPAEPVSLRTNVTRELLHTERTYVESLELLLKVYSHLTIQFKIYFLGCCADASRARDYSRRQDQSAHCQCGGHSQLSQDIRARDGEDGQHTSI